MIEDAILGSLDKKPVVRKDINQKWFVQPCKVFTLLNTVVHSGCT